MADTKSTMKDLSRKNWVVATSTEAQYPGDDKLSLGCQMRIADALETMANASAMMAKNFAALEEERDRWKRWFNDLEERHKRLQKQESVQRGLYTKSKTQHRKQMEQLLAVWDLRRTSGILDTIEKIRKQYGNRDKGTV